MNHELNQQSGTQQVKAASTATVTMTVDEVFDLIEMLTKAF
ncbi:MAG: hypothetical protein PHQ23_06315 [Candidatus Wallbacteria bacterium]|nr:hypothetical protein [Candidatus Wallbacteria bacterium]